MHSQTYEHVKKCETCRLTKPTNENTLVVTGKYNQPLKVGRVLTIDLVGPLPPAKHNRHTWLMVAVDSFSRYTFAKSVSRATAYAITDWLEKDIFHRFSVPERIVSDNGTQFKSVWFEKFLEAYRVEHFTTPVYHPQANQTEPTNKVLKQMLRAELMEKLLQHDDWASQVSKVIMGINTNARMPTGNSPHFIVYGCEKTMTGDEHRILNDVSEPIDNEKDRREAIYDEAAEKQRQSYEMNRRRHNLRATERKFNPGDCVFVDNHKQSDAGEKYSQKLAPLKRKAIVKEKVGTDTYLLLDWAGKDIGKYHANDMYRQ